MQLAAIQGLLLLFINKLNILGTLRDDWCGNCGEKGHSAWACLNK